MSNGRLKFKFDIQLVTTIYLYLMLFSVLIETISYFTGFQLYLDPDFIKWPIENLDFILF